MSENNDTIRTPSIFDVGTWALVDTGGAIRYLGKCDISLIEKADVQVILDRMAAGKPILLRPVFEYVNQINFVPGMDPNTGTQTMGVRRNPVVLPYDHTVYDAGLHVIARTILFLDELNEKDRAGYIKMAERAMLAQMSAREEESASQPGGQIMVVGGGFPGAGGMNPAELEKLARMSQGFRSR